MNAINENIDEITVLRDISESMTAPENITGLIPHFAGFCLTPLLKLGWGKEFLELNVMRFEMKYE